MKQNQSRRNDLAVIAAVGITALAVGKASYDSGYRDGGRDAKPVTPELPTALIRRDIQLLSLSLVTLPIACFFTKGIALRRCLQQRQRLALVASPLTYGTGLCCQL